jgi:hypothetical protein
MMLTDDQAGGCSLFDLLMRVIFGVTGVTCEEESDDDDGD